MKLLFLTVWAHFLFLKWTETRAITMKEICSITYSLTPEIWSILFYSILFYSILFYSIQWVNGSGGRADLCTPVRAKQISHNLLCDVCMLLFSWFEPWLDNRLSTFVVYRVTDYWDILTEKKKKKKKKKQPTQSERLKVFSNPHMRKNFKRPMCQTDIRCSFSQWISQPLVMHFITLFNT